MVDKLGVYVLTSKEKWGKLKRILVKWFARLQSGDTDLMHKEFLSDSRF